MARSPSELVVYPPPEYERLLYPPLLVTGIRRVEAE